MLEILTEISYASIDDYMINGQGFSKVREEENGKVRVYGKNKGNIDNLIMITVTDSPDHLLNLLNIGAGKNIDIQGLKNELLDSGYEYRGQKDSMLPYVKGEKGFTIRENINKYEINQILFIPVNK